MRLAEAISPRPSPDTPQGADQRRLPVYAQHHAVDSGTNPQHGDPVARLDVTALQSDGQRHGQRDRTRVAQPGERHKIVFRSQSQRLEHQLPMHGADLMAERAVDVRGLPVRRFQELAKSLDARGDALPHQLFRVGCHQRLHAAADGFVAAALAQLMKIRIGAHGGRQQAVARATLLAVRQQDGTAGRANRQGSDCRLDAAARQRDVAIQCFDGGFDQRPAAFRTQDEGRADLAEFDHVCRLQDAVHQPQAGIRHVVQDATAAQSQTVMDAASRGWLQVVAAHGAVDQRPDLSPIDSRGGDG